MSEHSINDGMTELDQTAHSCYTLSIRNKATPSLRSVQLADGTTLAYRELGPPSGKAVLLLHGWPTSSYLWRNVMPWLADQHRVLAVDLPGFGGSDKPARGRYGIDDFEKAIDGFLSATGVDTVTVVGHDIGGPVAAHWALSNPGRTTALVLLNTLLYPDFHSSVFEFVKTMTTPSLRDQQTSPEGLAEFMRTGMADPAKLSDDTITAVVAPFASAEDRKTLARAGLGLKPQVFEEIASGLPTLTMPVGAVYGVQDRILPDVKDTMTRLQRDLPHATITALPDCGHFLQEESPDVVGRLIGELLVS